MAFSPGHWEARARTPLKDRFLGLLAELVREREITDVLHQLLSFFAANPAEVFGHFAFIERRIDVDVEVTPDRIRSVEDVFFARLDGGGSIILLDFQMLCACAIGRAAVADAVLVLSDRLEDGGRARHGLRAGSEVSSFEDVFLEELVSAGAVFAAIDGDWRVGPANLTPVFDPALKDFANLLDREFGERIAFVDVNRQAVESHFVFGWAATEGLDALGDFRATNFARRVGEVGGF